MSGVVKDSVKSAPAWVIAVAAVLAVPVALQFALPAAWWVLPFLLMLIGIAAGALFGGWPAGALASAIATAAVVFSRPSEAALEVTDMALLIAGAGALVTLMTASTRRSRAQSEADHAALRRQVHERAAAELRLAASEQRFRSFVDALPDMLFTADPALRAHLLGAGWVDAAGVDDGGAVALIDAVHVDDRELVHARWTTAVSTGRTFDVRCRLRARDGAFRWVLVRAQASGAAAVGSDNWFGAIVDIDRQMSAEQALRETDERLHLALDATGLGLWDYNFATDTAACSARVYSILGLPDGATINQATWHALIVPEDLQDVIEHVRRSITVAGSPQADSAATLDIEYRIRRADDGALTWVALTGRITCDADTSRLRLRRATGTLRDITGRRETEARVRRSEERLVLAQQAGGIGMFDWDVRSNALSCSPTEVSLLGLAPSEAPRTFADLSAIVHPHDAEQMAATLQSALERAPTYADTFRIVRPSDGATRWVSAQATIVRSENDAPLRMTGVHRDVTDERVAALQLEASEERFRLAAEALDGLIYDYDPVTDRADRSRGLATVTGFPLEEAPPTGAWWRGRVHRDDLVRVATALDRARADHALRLDLEYRVRHRDGHYVFVNDRAYLVWREGAVVRRVGVVTDVTERRRIERVLRDTDRRKDEFLAVLAHELRNPLAPIRNAVQVIARASDPQAIGAAAALLERQVSQMVRLIDDLLDVSRVAQGKLRLRRTPTTLAPIVDAAIETVHPLIEMREQTLTRTLPEADIPLEADAVRLSQVIANLLHNASKFTPTGGSIALTAALDATAQAIEVRVMDTGLGIEAESLEDIFTMFSQLSRGDDLDGGRGRHDGLGIGLALARAVVGLHGGTLHAESEGLGRGAALVLRLPLAAAPRAAKSPARAPDEGARRRVLVVDDNRDSAESLAAVLRLDRHDVFVAFGGREALRIAEREHPDLVLLDIGMPDLDGYEVARLLRANEPTHTRIVALSGYGQVSDREKSIAAGCDAHLVKPVAPAELATWLASDAAIAPAQGSPAR